MLDNRLRVNFDLYNKKTDPQLLPIGYPSSTGVSSIHDNMGMLKTRGFASAINYQIIRKQDFYWAVNASTAHTKATYHDFGQSMERFSEENRTSQSLYRYVDGNSPDDLWAVKSMGIDPGTGREIFLKRDGTQTFEWDKADEVVVGNSSPDLEGVIGSRVWWKGFSLGIHFRYRIGGQAFMTDLYNKVENADGNNIAGAGGKWFNQDRRALYDRWRNPGDEAKFMAITIMQANPISSRFVMDNNQLSAESINFSYETSAPWVQKVGMRSVTFSAYLNDIFRISTIKNERSTDYPHAHIVSFSIGMRF